MTLYGTYKERRARAIRAVKRDGPVDWEAMQKRIARMSRKGRMAYMDAHRGRVCK